jgi:hypothetical protein
MIGVYGRNLFGSRANLGDINPISYVRRSDGGEPIPLVAVTHPRELGLELKHSF